MSDICWNFTYRCTECGETVQVTNGVDSHPHAADLPALVIEGCTLGKSLPERVEQALADYELLNEPAPGGDR
jgi:hypothetical protein